MLSILGSTGYDPVTRRRTRRGLARVRPLLLPSAVVLAAVLLLGGLRGPEPAVEVPPGPVRVPDGRVLVVVTPAEPAVLGIAVPGTVVDVYAPAPPDTLLGPVRGGSSGAELLARGALVLAPSVATGAAAAVVAGTLGGGPPSSVVLAVTDAEARALAGHPGPGLGLAVLPRGAADGPTAGDERPGAGG